MKILYNIAGTCHSGGMERVLANKANWLVEHGYEVVIVTTDQRGEKPFFLLDKRIVRHDLGVNYEENNGRSVWNKLWYYPAKQIKHKKELTKILMAERPDVTVSMFCNDVSFLPDIKDGSRKVLEIHFSKFKRLQYGRKGLWRLADIWRNKHEEKDIRRFDSFVVLTEEDKGYWGELPNIEVIPNARTFTPTRIASLDYRKVVAVGRYTHQKGFERLIEAWRLLGHRHPEWSMDIVGDGEERERLQRLIDSYGLNSQITLKRPTTEIEKVYIEAGILAMSSRYEGLPMVLLEGQAYGLPIVSFQCQCGPADVVEDGVTGFLVPEGDVQALADRLDALMSDDLLRRKMGDAAVKASERYEEEKIMKQWTHLFDQITEN